MTYLDHAATARPDPEIIETMASAALKYPGNPSSPYPDGREAKAALDDARNRCASTLNVPASNLVFTSGGTESNSIILLSRLLNREPGTILVSGLEHPSVAEPGKALVHQGWTIKEIPPESDGRISPDRLAGLLENNPDTRLVAVMGVNNETGAVMPLAEVAAVIRTFEAGKRPIHFHADMVQAAGKTDFSLVDMDVDSASFAAHKIRGPRGVGLLYHRNPQFEAFLRGGGQEHGVRPGTENVSGAAAMAMALEKWGSPSPSVAELGPRLLEKLTGIDGAVLVPESRQRSPENYAPGIMAIAFPPVPGEVLARVLADSGYEVSTGSACSSNKKGKLPKAMTAMGIPKPVATGMIRVSIGPATTGEELDGFLSTLKSVLGPLMQVNRRT